MKNLEEIKESKDITTKEYVDGKMVIIDNTAIIEKINSGFDGYNPYVFNVSELLTEDEKNKLKNADAVQLALEKLGGNSYYRIALHKTESEEYFQGTGIVTSTINNVNTMSFVIFISYSLMQIKPAPIGYVNTNPNIFGDFSYVNKNYVNNQISTAGDGKFLPLVDGGRITNSEHPSLTGTLISSTGIEVDGDNEPHAKYGTEAYFYQKSEASDAMTEISYSGVYISKGGANSELTGLHLNLLEFKSGNGVVSGLATPTTNTQAANKAYVDTKATVHSYTASLSTTWTGTSAPYTQSISISGILSTDKPHITPVYSTTNATAILEKKAWNCISKAETSAGKITFTCFEEKPTQALSLQMEVIR